VVLNPYIFEEPRSNRSFKNKGPERFLCVRAHIGGGQRAFWPFPSLVTEDIRDPMKKT